MWVICHICSSLGRTKNPAAVIPDTRKWHGGTTTAVPKSTIRSVATSVRPDSIVYVCASRSDRATATLRSGGSFSELIFSSCRGTSQAMPVAPKFSWTETVDTVDVVVDMAGVARQRLDVLSTGAVHLVPDCCMGNRFLTSRENYLQEFHVSLSPI